MKGIRQAGLCNFHILSVLGSSRNPEGKKSYLSGSKKIKEMSYDQFLRFIFPEGMFDYLSCLISKKSRIG